MQVGQEQTLWYPKLYNSQWEVLIKVANGAIGQNNQTLKYK